MGDNSYEYIVKQKAEGGALTKKLGMIALYLVCGIVLLSVSMLLPPPDLRLPLLLISAAMEALLIFISWRYVCVEYEIIISGGDILITTLYGKGSRKTLINLAINSFSEIGEYDDEAYEEISKLSLQKNYLCISSLSAPCVYYAIFEEDKDRCILYFDADDRAAELLKKYNSGAFRASARRIGKK